MTSSAAEVVSVRAAPASRARGYSRPAGQAPSPAGVAAAAGRRRPPRGSPPAQQGLRDPPDDHLVPSTTSAFWKSTAMLADEDAFAR